MRSVVLVVDEVEPSGDVGREGALDGDGVFACLDLDDAVAAEGFDQLFDGHAGDALEVSGYDEDGEYEDEMGFDGVTFVVVDWVGCQVGF